MTTNAAVLVPILMILASEVVAQPAGLVDDASLVLTRAGAPFGTEAFRIVRRGGSEGIEYRVQATRTVDGRVVKSALTTDSAGSATTYSRSVTGVGAGQLLARRSLDRLTVEEKGARGSRVTKDYVFPAGTLILDDEFLHHLYFVTWRTAPTAIGFVSLRAPTTAHGTVAEIGPETVTIRGQAIPAWHFAFGEGNARRDIWIDSQRRLLKVFVPSRQIEGTRDFPPP